jgi:hypothetical protein
MENTKLARTVLNGTKILIETTVVSGDRTLPVCRASSENSSPLEGSAAAVSDMIPDKLRASR